MWNLSHVIVACRYIHVKNSMVLRKEVVEPIDPWSFGSLVWRGSYLHDLYTLFSFFRREWMGCEWASMFWTKSVNELSSVALAVLYSWEGEFPDPMGILRAWHSCTNWDVQFWCLNSPGKGQRNSPNIQKAMIPKRPPNFAKPMPDRLGLVPGGIERLHISVTCR